MATTYRENFEELIKSENGFFTYEYKKIICFLNQVLVENMLKVCLLYPRPRKITGLVRWQHPVNLAITLFCWFTKS